MYSKSFSSYSVPIRKRLHTVPKNAFEAYRCSIYAVNTPKELARTIRPEEEDWDIYEIPSLKILALRVLAVNWETYLDLENLPTCVDQAVLLELLPTNLPIRIMIENIPYEYYWERSSNARWENNNLDDHGGSWFRLYCEKHLTEYLESLEPYYFDAEREHIEELISLVKDFIYKLDIRRLISMRQPRVVDAENESTIEAEDSSVHHIPFDIILRLLPTIEDLRLKFGMIYMDDGFEWRDFEFSTLDCQKLGAGIRDSKNLRTFSLTRSNLDQPKATVLLRGLAVNNTLVEINLSHCKLGDGGAHAVGGFLMENKYLQILHVVNNNIGPNGVAGIVYALAHEEVPTSLRHLNLRLNPIKDAGSSHICSLLLRTKTLETLNISSCSLTTHAGINLAEVIASGSTKFPKLSLDLSNNKFGSYVGKAFELAAKSCPFLLEVDARMCFFDKDSEYILSDTLSMNRAQCAKVKNQQFRLKSISSVKHRKIVRCSQQPIEFPIFEKLVDPSNKIKIPWSEEEVTSINLTDASISHKSKVAIHPSAKEN